MNLKNVDPKRIGMVQANGISFGCQKFNFIVHNEEQYIEASVKKDAEKDECKTVIIGYESIDFVGLDVNTEAPRKLVGLR